MKREPGKAVRQIYDWSKLLVGYGRKNKTKKD
jgi:hypothetical protein